MGKYALLIGLNYSTRLKNSIKNTLAMRDYLIKKRGYSVENIVVLLDTYSPTSATYPNYNTIDSNMSIFFERARDPTNELFLYYSGLGIGKELNTPDNFTYHVKRGIVASDYVIPISTIITRYNMGLQSCEAPILWVMDCPNYATYKILPYIYNYTTTNLQIEYNDIVEDYHNSTDPDPDVRKIYLLSGCNNKNKYTEGRLTTELLKLLNKNSTDNFVNIFNRLNNNIKKYKNSELPNLSSTQNLNKNIMFMKSKLPVKRKLSISHKLHMKNKSLVKSKILIKNKSLVKSKIHIKNKSLVKSKIPVAHKFIKS